MKKFVALIATAILASLLLVIPTSPASADTGVCAPLGNANLVNGLYYPIVGPKRIGPFTFNMLPPSMCVTDAGTKSLTAGGTVNGWCGLSAGWGTASGDGTPSERFWFVGIGGVLLVGGHITGVAVAVPFPPAVNPVLPGQSCLPTGPGARNFLVAGAVVKNHVVPADVHDGDPKLPPDLPPPFPLCPNPPICPPR